MFLSEFSMKRPVFATVVVLALVVLGIYGFMSLNINDYPEADFPYVAVLIQLPGASPEQLDSDVAEKVEEAMGQISGIKHISSTITEGASLTLAEFTLETSPSEAAQNVRDKLGSIRGDLPSNIEEPVVSRFDPNSMPIISLAVTGSVPMKEMTKVAEDIIQPRLETINGVGSVNIYGSETREIQLQVIREKLAALELTTSEVVQNLGAANLDVPGGKVGAGNTEMGLRTIGQVNRVDQLGQLPVARINGQAILVNDIAKVVDGVEEPESICRYQGQPAIGLEVVKQSGSNTVAVNDSVKKALTQLQSELPSGIKIEIVRDNSISIRSGLKDVLRTMIEGIILAVLVVFLFLKDWRRTAISALAIPTSIISAFFAMKVMGFSLNNLSLMAMTLSVGLLIDDAIVVIENISRHLKMGKNPLQAARDGTSEIGLAVMATTFTLVAVFVPVGMMTGITGKFFKEFALSVVFSVLVSLLIAFTLVPLLSSRFLKEEGEKPMPGVLGRFLTRFNLGFDTLSRRYVVLLEKVLRHRWKTLGIAVLLFLVSLSAIPYLGSSFIPVADMGEITILADCDSGLSLNGGSQTCADMEQVLKGIPEVTGIYSTVSSSQVRMLVNLAEKHNRQLTQEQIITHLRKKLNAIPGVKVTINVKSGLVEGKTVQLLLQGTDTGQLQDYADKIQQIMGEIPGVVDIASSYKPGKPEATLQIDQQRAADFDVSAAQIGQTIRALFNGVIVSDFKDGDDRIDIRLRLGEDQRLGTADLKHIFLREESAAKPGENPPLVALNQVSKQAFKAGSSELRRFDRSRVVEISANLDGISLGEFNKIFAERTENALELPPGYKIFASGDSERMSETSSAMAGALLLGIIFVFFVLAAQFESYIDPFSILLALPMAVIGGIGGLFIAGSEMSMMSMIGIIMLMGLVTKNAILLVDFIKQERKQGTQRNEALRKAAATRFRPIMMTSIAMILGMVPLALALGTGSESRAPMAHAIIGGLVSSTLLTLVVVPVFYTILDDLKNKRSHVKEKIANEANINPY